MEPDKVTRLTARNTERLALNNDQRVVVARRHAELTRAADAWAEVLVLLGVDEGRILGLDIDKGYFLLAPTEAPEGSDG